MAVDVEGDHRRSMPKALLDRFHGLPTLNEEAGVEMSEQVKAVAFGDAETGAVSPVRLLRLSMTAMWKAQQSEGRE
jgi:hypothetical protein